jgi:F0F1-type ATP synthase membrane subunit c/vacuolar-type H+-ATPase subunit K
LSGDRQEANLQSEKTEFKKWGRKKTLQIGLISIFFIISLVGSIILFYDSSPYNPQVLRDYQFYSITFILVDLGICIVAGMAIGNIASDIYHWVRRKRGKEKE